MSGLDFAITAGLAFVAGGGFAAAVLLWWPTKCDGDATISRLTAEKHARDVALRRVIEAAESVHAQGDGR